MAKIYVSSTYLDLKDCREQVRVMLHRMGHQVIGMEYYSSEQRPSVEKCLADVAGCDLYLGLFAWRYGWVPETNNPGKLSITEMEYRHALAKSIDVRVFLLDGKAAWPGDSFDDDQAQIKRLRNELSEKHSPGFFNSEKDIVDAVAPAVYNWAKEHGHIPATVVAIPELNLTAYYSALRKRYGVLALEGLTPPQKEEYLQIQLRSVFVEQNVRENPPPVELPKEVWEKLSRDKEIHPEDLPSGITLDDVRKAREAYYEKPARPVLEVLTDVRYQHAIILGDPGSGKSTLARYVVLSLIDAPDTLTPTLSRSQEQRTGEGEKLGLPLLIELRSYAGLIAENKCETFLEFLEYLGKTEGWGLTQIALHNYLKNDGRAVVFFDGLDEIFDPELRERIAHQIVGFAGDYPKARIIVTSRVIGYRRKILTDAGFTHFTLQDLDEKQVETFVSRWYDLAMSERPDEAKERRERILRSFNESASIRALAGNPMLLTIMAIIGKHQELPRERWKLYDHAASVLIQHWDVNKHLKDARIDADFIGEDDKKELLRRLAFRMQGAEENPNSPITKSPSSFAGNYIHRDELLQVFEEYLKARYAQPPDSAAIIARAMIEQFRERNFILSLYGANVYGFVHRAFLEFFCASAFVYKFEKTKDLTIEQLKTDVYGKHWEDQGWHEVLRLICGMVDEKWAGQIIGHLVDKTSYPWPADRDEFDKRPPWNLLLATQCLCEVRNLTLIADPAGQVLLRICEFFGSLDFRQRTSYPIREFLEGQLFPTCQVIGSNWPDQSVVTDWLNNQNEIESGAYWQKTGSGEYFYYTDWPEFLGLVNSGRERARQVFKDYALDRRATDDRCLMGTVALVVGWRSDPETFSILSENCVRGSTPFIRIMSLSVLVKYYYENPQTISILRDRAVNDKSPLDAEAEFIGVREGAINAIAQNWPTLPGSLVLLRERARNDPAPLLRKRAKELADEIEDEAKQEKTKSQSQSPFHPNHPPNAHSSSARN